LQGQLPLNPDPPIFHPLFFLNAPFAFYPYIQKSLGLGSMLSMSGYKGFSFWPLQGAFPPLWPAYALYDTTCKFLALLCLFQPLFPLPYPLVTPITLPLKIPFFLGIRLRKTRIISLTSSSIITSLSIISSPSPTSTLPFFSSPFPIKGWLIIWLLDRWGLVIYLWRRQGWLSWGCWWSSLYCLYSRRGGCPLISTILSLR